MLNVWLYARYKFCIIIIIIKVRDHTALRNLELIIKERRLGCLGHVLWIWICPIIGKPPTENITHGWQQAVYWEVDPTKWKSGRLLKNWMGTVCQDLKGRVSANTEEFCQSVAQWDELRSEVKKCCFTDCQLSACWLCDIINCCMPLSRFLPDVIVMYAIWHIRPHSPLASLSWSLRLRSPNLSLDCPDLLTCHAAGRVVPEWPI